MTARTRTTKTPRARRIFRPMSASPPIDEKRSLIELGIEVLLIAIGAQQFPAGEAYQIRGCARPVNRAHQFGRAIDSTPVPRLADPNANWCELHHHQVGKGA